MPSMDKQTVAKVASLARLDLTEEELEKFGPQLSNILQFVEQLSEVDTEGVEALPSPVDIPLRLREDAVTDGACTEKVLSNAPEALEDYYVVQKIVE